MPGGDTVPMETCGTAACTRWFSFARTNQGDRLSVPLIIEDICTMIVVIWLKFLFFVKCDEVNSHLHTDDTSDTDGIM